MTTPTRPAPATDPQADVIAFLMAPDTLCPGERAQRIDTHAARIFLAGDRAWKLKRAVDLGYLDFSSEERRRDALEAELALNRRTAPDLYLGVWPVCRDEAGAVPLWTGSWKCAGSPMTPCSKALPLTEDWMTR
jgi:hypothetical protein